MRVLLFTILLVTFVLWIEGQQRAPIEWQVAGEDILASDRVAIVKLVYGIGLEPERISVGIILPGGDHYIYVRSAILAEGKHRSWREVNVCRKDWTQCNNAEGRSVKRVGRWMASKAAVDRREAWRIDDDGWGKDVSVEAGVPFADAERIVLAIRRKQMVNRVPVASVGPLKLNRSLPDINPDDITYIKAFDADSKAYEVTIGIGGGFTLRLKIVGSEVELTSYSEYMV
jgi:hypothetical protein